MSRFALWCPLILVVVASLIDLRSNRIPNWIVGPFLVLGIISSGIARGFGGMLDSLAGVALAAAVLGIPVWLGGFGAGDLKLCAAVGAWVGPSQLVNVLVFTGIAGGVIAVIWAARNRFLGDALDNTSYLLTALCREGQRLPTRLHLKDPAARALPYGPAIALGTLFSLFAVR